ncbi:unnamed protein product [Paramecium primaurelia]|uniref:F-box domain-containing protein n=1 Tax=Paramecium primaurelia TaxID=5886 RepID=A0A8S1M5J5_PARPR|nr:unnamed protein product [Paramecium primaurelia]
MLQELKSQLHYLSENNKKNQQCIKDLFIQFQEIQVNYRNKNSIDKPKQDLFYKVRPEVINQILIFLDFITVQKFRLVSKRTNYIVLHLLPIIFQNQLYQIQNIENSIQEYVQNNPNSPQQEEIVKQAIDKSVNEVKQIKMQDIAILKTLHNPPMIVETIFQYLMILFDFNQESQKSWAQSQKLIQHQQFHQKLTNIDYESISDRQLHLLQPIKDIIGEQVRDVSIEAFKIYQFIQTIVLSNESQKQLIYIQLQKKKKKLITRHQVIEKLIAKYQ